MSLYRERAVVLRTHKFGEADRVVVMLTENEGKVRTVAKGVRKTGSRIGARLEPLSHVEVQLWRGRELDTVRQVDLIETNTDLRSDFERMSRGLAMVEAIDKITPDREPVPHLYRMLSRALTALNRHNSPLMLGAFFWKVLAAEGSAPRHDSCFRCETTDDLVAIDLTEGGVTCAGCRSGTAVSASALALLAQVLDGELGAALSAPESPAVHEVNNLATRAMEHHLERRLRSIGVLDAHL